MKLCKKIVAAVLVAALFAVCIPVFGADLPAAPEVPEGYDGYVTVGFSAILLGWGYILEPVLVPYHEGECVAEVTVRALDMNYIGSYYSTEGEGSFDGFYLMGVECSETEPNVPQYLMDEMLAYPEWAVAQFGYSYGEWTGAYEDDGFLSNMEYSDFSGWMYLDNDVSPWDGADALIVEDGHVYTWYFTIYGWGMDYGVSDGWGSFPVFDNPMEGVSRTEVSSCIALVNSDEELAALVEERAAEEYAALLEAFIDPETSQEELDALLEAFLEALGLDEPAYETGDVNMDGQINSLDALVVMRHVMNLALLNEDGLALADFDGNGEVNMVDALLIMRAAM